MSHLDFTLLATQDLNDIHDYLAEKSPKAAERFIEQIEKRCLRIAEMPGIGRSRDELAAGLRSVPEGSYVIFYQPLEEGVMIVRVLHGARDIEGLFDARRKGAWTDEDEV